MSQSLITIMTNLKPLIIFAGLVPFVAALIMWGIFYIRYDMGRLSKIRDSFRKLADEGEKFKDCKKENLTFMDEMIVRMAPPYFLEAYLRMEIQIDKSFKGEFIPEGQSFYDYDAMVTAPGARSRLEALWKSFWVLSIITVAAPVGAAYLSQSWAINRAFVFGMFFFVLLCIAHLIFTMLDQRIYLSTKSEYHRFVGTFNRVLPVAKPEVALLLEATQRNQEAYKEATDKIGQKFDNLVDEMLLPALEDSIATIMHSNLIPALLNIPPSDP